MGHVAKNGVPGAAEPQPQEESEGEGGENDDLPSPRWI